jgi:CRP-like cAMP-binding protein
MGLFGGKGGDPKVEGLRHVTVFSECSGQELQWIASRMDEIEVGAGETLTHQGQPGHTFYVLLDGQVEAAIDGKAVATLGVGDFFGEISMLDRGPATATCTSKAPSRLLVMSHEQFRDAVKSNDAVLSGVMAAMASRLRANAELGFKAR